MQNVWIGFNLQRQLRILLVVLTVLLGQTLAMGTTIAHEVDPAHSADDCSICLTVQANDTAPPPAAHDFDMPPVLYWAVGETATQEAVIKALSGTTKARAPPL